MRQIVLDTETTGLEPSEGHRIIEIGCVELVSRRLTGNDFHQYLNPDREVEQGAIDVHGITNEMLADKPRFADIAEDFLRYIDGAELVIHNAPFDVGFLNHELKLWQAGEVKAVETVSTILDTLALARKMHPGQRNSLDALCKRYEVDNSSREYHGALLDAQILAEVYLMMTGGQTTLVLDSQEGNGEGEAQSGPARIEREGLELVVSQPSDEEASTHAELLESMRGDGGHCLWDNFDTK
ncbi:MAG: DNA polymerase III subunit epsilon [Gammaproteobacteria bacterium]|nr:DNA polymerase III subunit epsilon [Gammaproteobacteria bacterium]